MPGAQAAGDRRGKKLWDIKALWKAPAIYPAPGLEQEGVRSFYYEGLPFQGHPTRVFAYYGAPPPPPGTRLPAMVLVHGGGGTAFASWVRLWNSRGYAAIAMDLCGCIPEGSYNQGKRQEWGGPPGWGGFDQIDWPVADQWSFHAVADVILAQSLLRSFREVDPDRIGMTGISWGGYLACIVSGVDHRFKFSVPVYGCGFLGEDSVWLPDFERMGKEKAARWLELWDPSHYLPDARMPMLWVDGTNDFAYPLDSVQKSYRLARSSHTLCTRVRMPHGHGGPGENPPEIHAFADTFCKGGAPLAKVKSQGAPGGEARAVFQSAMPVETAELNYTRNRGKWQDRVWETLPAHIDPKKCRVSAQLPAGVAVYYFNVVDSRGLIVSTEHVEVAPS